MSPFRAAWVVGRRDFTATVMSRSFFLFLFFPVLIIGISGAFGGIAGHMAQQDDRPRVAVVASEADFAPIAAARDRLKPAFHDFELAELVRAEPDYDRADQVTTLLAASDKRFIAVLTGGLAHPRLTGALDEDGPVRRQIAAMLDQARQQAALAGARVTLAPVAIDLVKVEQSAGSLASNRALTARFGQMLLFILTVMLAGMLLSNLIEEKSNKVIEVLAAAIPIDSIFLGKLGAMLCVSLVGISVWVAAGFLAVQLWPTSGGALPVPAVGWPLFLLLVFLYFGMNYLLLGALFLGIGSQASTVREVQTISMPVTIGQVLVFFFATVAVGPFNSLLGISAAIFPFSSPMTMIARAAQTGEIWPHLAALLWQALWVWIIIQLGAAFFRRNVMKSGGGPAAAFGRRRRG